MRRIRLREASRAEVPLLPVDALWLQELGVATCAPSRTPGCVDVRTENVAGLVSNGRIAVEIAPKLPLGEFAWLLAYAATGVKLAAADVLAAPTDVSEALGAVLAHLVERAVEGGLLRGYREEERTSPVLRGRLRLTDQLTRHHGRLHPLELSVGEFDADIAENQIMRAGVARALATAATGGGSPFVGVQGRLRRLLRTFDGVTPLQLGAPLLAWRRTSRNVRAWAAIELAELLLRGWGLDVAHGATTSAGMLIQTWRVFEAAVGRGLQEARPDWVVSTQRTYPLTAGIRPLSMRPDLVVESRGRPIAVADTKYRAPIPTADEIYQLFTYAGYLGLPRAHLIYAGHLAEPHSLPVGNTGVAVVAHGVSLEHPSSELVERLGVLAERLS